MSRHSSRSYTDHAHDFIFMMEDAAITVDEMGNWVAGLIKNWESETIQESFAHDVSYTISRGIIRKVDMAKAQTEKTRIRNLWIKLNPPNHAGYYYCHIGGEWVSAQAMELEHIVPSSLESIDTDKPGWQDKLRPSCTIHNNLKGSRQIPSATLEIRPPDEEC